jgi:hypothetical protein
MAELNTGFDRADGLGGRLGTPDPAGAIAADSGGLTGTVEAVATIEEDVDSPTIERAEQGTISHQFRMSWAEAKFRIQLLGRGFVREDSNGNVVKLLSSSIQHQKLGLATLKTVDESISFDSPPDQFQIVPVELGVNIIKHPRYFYAFLGAGQGSLTEQRNQMVIRLLQNYFENTTAAYRDALTSLIFDSLGADAGSGDEQPPLPTTFKSTRVDFASGAKVSGTDMAKRAALEIIQKYWRGEETPYVIGYQIDWASFYFRPPYLNPGGYIENPMTDAVPLLPDYFWSPDYPPSSNTIFDALDSVNPQCYSATGLPGGGVNISWLRKADQIDYERTWMKITRTWIGSPVGFWDTELYSAQERPQSASDYLQIASLA